ncbi:hypothetical protein JIR23_26235 [Bradyrhizobium diazoefficiens]|nr:hypothetical protein [Bradyrhizobium diazoefficiens]QQN63005.1 hypothetical protein JIR23_26235 [Bradyrhizobium diazoefficiens]
MIEGDEDDDTELIDYLEAMDLALTVHEAGHTVVARALGAEIVFVEIDLATGNGGSRSRTFDDDQIKNLAVCVAGCRAEHLLDARSLRRTKIGDFRLMRALLARLPDAERRAARAAGYRLADEILKANADAVRRVADELLARRWKANTTVVRIPGDELIALLSG